MGAGFGGSTHARQAANAPCPRPQCWSERVHGSVKPLYSKQVAAHGSFVGRTPDCGRCRQKCAARQDRLVRAETRASNLLCKICTSIGLNGCSPILHPQDGMAFGWHRSSQRCPSFPLSGNRQGVRHRTTGRPATGAAAQLPQPLFTPATKAEAALTTRTSNTSLWKK